LQNFIVPISQNFQASRLKETSANAIDFIVVLRTIQFHHKLFRVTVKIHYIRRDRVLAAKLETIQLPGSQPPPQLLFGIRSALAQLTRMIACSPRQRWFDASWHDRTLTPTPLPRGEGLYITNPTSMGALNHKNPRFI
jgi:hypothetical protein